MKKGMLLLMLSSVALYAQPATNGTPAPQNGQTPEVNSQPAPQNGQIPAQSGAPQTTPQPSAQIQWMTDYEQSLAMAGKSNKPVILYFTGSDWCGWCKKMDQEVFSSSAFVQSVGNKFVFVKVDFPMNTKLPEGEMRQNAQLKQRYGVTGYPTVVIVDKQGGFIGETGYRSGGGKAYAQWLEQFITN